MFIQARMGLASSATVTPSALMKSARQASRATGVMFSARAFIDMVEGEGCDWPSVDGLLVYALFCWEATNTQSPTG